MGKLIWMVPNYYLNNGISCHNESERDEFKYLEYLTNTSQYENLIKTLLHFIDIKIDNTKLFNMVSNILIIQTLMSDCIGLSLIIEEFIPIVYQQLSKDEKILFDKMIEIVIEYSITTERLVVTKYLMEHFKLDYKDLNWMRILSPVDPENGTPKAVPSLVALEKICEFSNDNKLYDFIANYLVIKDN